MARGPEEDHLMSCRARSSQPSSPFRGASRDDRGRIVDEPCGTAGDTGSVRLKALAP